MPKKKQPAKSQSPVTPANAVSQPNVAVSKPLAAVVSQRHAALLVGAFVLMGLLLFSYPGDSFYVRLFSFHQHLFNSASQDKNEFTPAPVPYVREGSAKPFLTATAAYVIDLDTATPVYAQNEHLKLYPASTTKVITALTAADIYTEDDVLVANRIIDEGQTMGLVPGEKITFKNLMYGLLVHSGNDAAYVIADNYPDGYNAFVERMNQKAQALGMSNSRFTNPAGLDSSLQQSTAFDLALAGRELLKSRFLADIVSTKSITVSDIDFAYFHPLFNVNRLLGEIPGVAGLKTGKTDLAGENLITLYKWQGHEYLIVLLRSEDRFTDTQSVVTWLQSSVVYYPL